MALKTRIEPIERDIAVLFPEDFSPAARSQAIASFAREAFTEAAAQNRSVLGRDAPYEQFVDARRGASLESVKPDGKIVFEWELLEEVFAWVDEQLVKHSPVGTRPDKRPGHPGLYKASHIFVVDGQIADPATAVAFQDEAFFANTVPYSRKIEGSLSRAPLSRQAPDGVYQVVAKLASQRFSNLARIKFGYRSLMVGGIHEWAATTRMQTKRRSAAREDWLRRQPAVIVTLR
jgi:hypothetical protein